METQRKLIALDADDLAVISANVLDAVVRAGDIIWRRDEKRLVLGMNRLDWDVSISGKTSPRRLLSALRFERVLSCRSRNIDPDAPDVVLDMIGIEFDAGDPPAGNVVLLFAGGSALRLEVECLECELADLGLADFGISEGAVASEFGV